MTKKYTAFVVYSGTGDDYQKHAVTWDRESAEKMAQREGMKVWQTGFDSKYDLETLLEDNLTAEQAALFLTNPTCPGCGQTDIKDWSGHAYGLCSDAVPAGRRS